jgi:hypothetical protein
MHFESEYSGDAWKESEVLKRKERIVKKIFDILDVETRLKKLSGKTFISVLGTGIDADGKPVKVGFDADITQPGKNICTVYIQDETDKILYRIERIIQSEYQDESLINLRKTVEDLTLDDSAREIAEGTIRDFYSIDDHTDMATYLNDNFPEKPLSAEEAEKSLELIEINPENVRQILSDV